MIDERIPELNIEYMTDENGSLILLEQDSGGQIDRLAIHPIHLRFMAEKCGLVETSDAQALKTIAMLKRRMRILRDRICTLSEYMEKHSDKERANLDYEIASVTAAADLAQVFCDDGEPACAASAVGQTEFHFDTRDAAFTAITE